MFLKYTADPNQQLAAIDFWTMGSMAGITRDKILPTLLCVLFCSGLLFLLVVVVTLGDLDGLAIGAYTLQRTCKDMQFAGLEIRFPPTHVGGVQHEHQGLEIRGVGCEHGAMGCLGIFRAGG